MMRDFISAPNDICIVFGLCDYLGKISEIELEHQSNTTRIPETPPSVSTVRSRKFIKLCFHSSRGELFSKNILLRMLGMQTAKD